MSESIVSVERALDVILTLYNNGKEMGISDLSRELGLHKSTVHRILASLEKKKFVYQNLENEKYWLSMKLYAIGLLVGEKLSLVDVLKPYAKILFDEFNEVVNVSVLDEDASRGYKSLIILKEADVNKVLSVNPHIGTYSDAHVSSVGKCLLAFSKDIDIKKLFSYPMKQYTKNTIKNYEELIKELQKVKENGYALDNEEQEIGLTCIGAPILDKSGNAIAAISISGPSSRMKEGDFNKKIQKVKDIANKISLSLK